VKSANVLVHNAHKAIRKHNRVKAALKHDNAEQKSKVVKKNKRVVKTKIEMKNAISVAKVAIKNAKNSKAGHCT